MSRTPAAQPRPAAHGELGSSRRATARSPDLTTLIAVASAMASAGVPPRFQYFARLSVTLASVFAGAYVVHSYFQPDLTIRTPEKPEAPVEGFVAAPAFGGAKAGFVFRSGPNGLGYYPDRRA